MTPVEQLLGTLQGLAALDEEGWTSNVVELDFIDTESGDTYSVSRSLREIFLELAELAEAGDTLLSTAASLLDLYAHSVDDDPCQFDHHGGCQAHGFSLGPGEVCPAVRADLLLRRLGRR